MKRYRTETAGGHPVSVTVLSGNEVRRKLNEYEAKYNMTSEAFLQKYRKYQFKKEDIELMDWASYCDMAAELGVFDSGTDQ